MSIMISASSPVLPAGALQYLLLQRSKIFSPLLEIFKSELRIISLGSLQPKSKEINYCQAQPSSSSNWAEFSLISKLSSHPARPTDPTRLE